MREKASEDLVARFIPPGSYPAQWDIEGLERAVAAFVPGGLPIAKWAAEDGVDDEVLIDRILEEFDQHMAAKAAQIGADTMRMAERQITLQVLDQLWREHIQNMTAARGRDPARLRSARPLVEYRRDGFEMFDGLLERHRNSVVLANLESVSLNHHRQHRLLPLGAAAGGGAAAAHSLKVVSDADPVRQWNGYRAGYVPSK